MGRYFCVGLNQLDELCSAKMIEKVREKEGPVGKSQGGRQKGVVEVEGVSSSSETEK